MMMMMIPTAHPPHPHHDRRDVVPDPTHNTNEKQVVSMSQERAHNYKMHAYAFMHDIQTGIETLADFAVRAEAERVAILEERHHMTRWFSQLKRNKDQRFGFLSQPAFICVQIGQMLATKKKKFTNEDIKEAIKLWCSLHRPVAEARYGHIRGWNTSKVTNMSNLFRDQRTFNDDLSGWDTSKVTSMVGMFNQARAFNQDINAWDVSSVTDMQSMFREARSFNRDLNSWDVSNVTQMSNMFFFALVFNARIHAWDVSKVINMYMMFYNARAFDDNINAWNISAVIHGDNMFEGCPISVQNKPPRAFAAGW